MKTVFELGFTYYEEHMDENGEWVMDDEDEAVIAVYSKMELAKKALEKFKVQPRFAGHEEDLVISKYIVDEPHWTEGFYRAPKKDYSWKAVREREFLSK